jgi:hypothetical protein
MTPVKQSSQSFGDLQDVIDIIIQRLEAYDLNALWLVIEDLEDLKTMIGFIDQD